MADLAALQTQRKQIIAEIHKRNGNAPNYQKRLAAVDAQIRAARKAGGAATTPATPAGIQQAQNTIAANAGDAAVSNLQGTQLGTAFNPTLTDRPNTGQLEADRARIEEQVYGRLTRNLDQDYQAARQQNEQTLYNRGIPFSADPNSRYQQELGRLDQNYLSAKTDARQRAAEIGGAEYQRNFDIGETLRGNQFSEQAGTRNQQLGELGSLSGLGLPGTVSFEQLSDADKQRALEMALAKLQSRTSLGVAGIAARNRGGGSSDETSAFSSGTGPAGGM